MSQNDRICKVCGNSKRKYSNGCANSLCNFNEPEIVNDLDQITVMETIKLNQTQYLEKIFTIFKNISSFDEFHSFVSIVTPFIESPFVNNESKIGFMIKAQPILDSYNEYVTKELKKIDELLSINDNLLYTSERLINLSRELINYYNKNHQSEEFLRIIEMLLKINQELNKSIKEFSNYLETRKFKIPELTNQ